MIRRTNRRSKLALATTAVCVCGGLGQRTIFAQAVIPAAGKQWKSTWSDEFNIGASDLTGFTYDVGGGGWGNGEAEVYTAPPGSPMPQQNPGGGLGSFTTPTVGTNSNNVFVANSGGVGALNINLIATGSGGGQTYTSGRIKSTTNFTQTYGLFEWRAKLPAGQGLWPALWMMAAAAPPLDHPLYGGWPKSGEIDVMESKGQSPTLVQGTFFSGSDSNHIQSQTGFYSAPAGFTTNDWHTYDMEWIQGASGTSGTLKWYCDGNLYETRTGGWFVPTEAGGDLNAPFNQPFYILMNLAVGGNYGGAISLAAGSYAMQVDYFRAYTSIASSATPSWLGDASGNWTTSGNWTNSVIPNAVGATALFGNVITAPRTVTVDSPMTVGAMTFDSGVGYTIGGTQTVTLTTSGAAASVTVNSGTHAINAPLSLLRNTTFTIGPANASLAISSLTSVSTATLTKAGAGVLAVNNLRATGLAVNAGTVRVLPGGTTAGTSKIKTLTIAGTASTPTATLDLADNDFILDYTGGTPVDQFRQWIKAGHDLGTGITSSSATASTRLGYGDNAVLNRSTFSGQSVDSTSILVKYTYAGDANLDGVVDSSDLAALAMAWQQAAFWTSGDFNYDHVVNVDDLDLLAANWLAGVGNPLSSPSLGQALADLGLAVPEPTSTSVLMLLGVAGISGRRRSRLPH